MMPKALYQNSHGANPATAATLQAEEHKVKLVKGKWICGRRIVVLIVVMFIRHCVFALATFIEECL